MKKTFILIPLFMFYFTIYNSNSMYIESFREGIYKTYQYPDLINKTSAQNATNSVLNLFIIDENEKMVQHLYLPPSPNDELFPITIKSGYKIVIVGNGQIILR